MNNDKGIIINEPAQQVMQANMTIFSFNEKGKGKILVDNDHNMPKFSTVSQGSSLFLAYPSYVVGPSHNNELVDEIIVLED